MVQGIKESGGKTAGGMDEVFEEPRELSGQRRAWIIGLGKHERGVPLEDDVLGRSVPPGYAGIALSGEIEARGLSACTGIAIWDGKHKAGVLMHIPKEDDFMDEASRSLDGSRPLEDGFKHALRFLYGRIQGRRPGEVDLESMKPHLKENASAVMFGGNPNGLSPAYVNQVHSVGRKTLGLLDELGVEVNHPTPSTYYKDVDKFSLNVDSGEIKYRLAGGGRYTASMQG